MEILEKKHRWAQVPTHYRGTAHRDLAFINEPFNDAVALAEWRELGFTQSRFTGDMYDMRFAEPEFIDQFRLFFPWKHFSWSVYRMTPGSTLPEHSDTYARFCQLYSIHDPDTIYRAVVFLEDWQQGHYFDIMQRPILQWRSGHCVIWQGSTPHTAANIGKTDRYTLQITGIPYSDPITARFY